MSAAKLYTPQLLAAAVELAQYPPLETASLHGDARSPTCGSTVSVDLLLNNASRIEQVGLKVAACAVGQGAAAVFARHVAGRSSAELAAAHSAIAAWLGGDAPQPDWPGLALIAPAKDYPARHGAMLAPWKAALAALSSAAVAS